MARWFANRGVILVIFGASFAGLSASCAPAIGNAIAVDKYVATDDDAPSDYVINVGDTLNILVWEQPSLSGPQPVRTDGKISIALINEIQAAGKTPAKLQAELEAALKSVVLNPRVTVGVANSKLPTISVMGEVGKQGPVDLTPGMGVAQALAAVGGPTTFARKDRIFVQRQTPDGTVRIHFTYDALLQGTGKAAQFKLKPGDTIIVQ